MGLREIWKNLVDAGGTGGLNWHMHAFQSQYRWQATVSHIEHFLLQCEPRHKHLLLMGCSAGWMMPTAWLTQFDRIDAYDIDPLAQSLFNWRHGRALRKTQTHVTHHRQEAMIHLPDILAEHQEASIWFDNMLGQHRYRIRDEAQVEKELRALKTTLQGRDWGSVHDLLSGPTQKVAHSEYSRHQDVRLNVYPRDMDSHYSQSLVNSLRAQGIWFDHLTANVFSDDEPTTLIPWEFKPNYWHWLQAGWHSA
jgi:hypothetical protein